MPDEARPHQRSIQIGSRIPRRSPEDPSDEELIRLVEGSLSDDQRLALEERLRSCPYSADRVAIVREALREAGVPLRRILFLTE